MIETQAIAILYYHIWNHIKPHWRLLNGIYLSTNIKADLKNQGAPV